MRSLLIPVALIATIALPTAAVPKALPISQARQAIQAAYNAQSAAFAARNADAYLAIRDPGYISINEHGQRRRGFTDSAAGIRDLMSVASNTSMTKKVQAVILQGNGAVVTVREHIQLTLPDPGSGVAHPIVGSELDRDFWVQTDQEWKLKRTHTLQETGTIDGKRMKNN